MFARILAFEVKVERKEEFVKVVKDQVLPILRKQIGFLEVLPFLQKNVTETKVLTISLWTTRKDAERYERESYSKTLEIPYAVCDLTRRSRSVTFRSRNRALRPLRGCIGGLKNSAQPIRRCSAAKRLSSSIPALVISVSKLSARGVRFVRREFQNRNPIECSQHYIEHSSCVS